MWDALRKIVAAGALWISVAGTAYAQDDASSIEAKTTLDDAPLTAPRTAAMGGASSTLADDIDASWANPAGIGGYGWGDKKIPTMRKFYFPFVGVAANENAREFQEDLNQRKNEEYAGVVERANRVIRQIFETEKFDLILQEAVFAGPRVDITDKVIRALNGAATTGPAPTK
jgi:hypothetical protein